VEKKMLELYQFKELEEKVVKFLGRKLVDKDYKVPKIHEKLNVEDLKKYIKFENDGIYIQKDNKRLKGFIYIEKGYQMAFEDERGNPTIVPKFHIKKCEVIEQMIQKNRFDKYYTFANYPVKMRDLDKIEKELRLCKYCLELTPEIDSVLTTSEYYKNFILNNEIDSQFDIESLPKNIDEIDYTLNWSLISKRIRKRNGYVCQKCGIKLADNYCDNYYLEVHHIDGNKSNNNEKNLQVLCVLCHAFIDSRHISNYSGLSLSSTLKLQSFLYEYKEEIIKYNNNLYEKALKIIKDADLEI